MIVGDGARVFWMIRGLPFGSRDEWVSGMLLCGGLLVMVGDDDDAERERESD